MTIAGFAVDELQADELRTFTGGRKTLIPFFAQSDVSVFADSRRLATATVIQMPLAA